MPSLFSRSRTNSSPNKKQSLSASDVGPSALDEFGRVSSRVSGRGLLNVNNSPSPASKKDKKRAKEEEKRLRTLSTTRERTEYEQREDSPLPTVPDGSFLPLNLERPTYGAGPSQDRKEFDYGYLSYERHVVLGLEQVARLVDIISEELGTRGGITTPFIFSNTALDISSSAIKRLIRAFLKTCATNLGYGAQEADMRWREEARFAGPHELGMCLRWALSRVVRSVGGHDVRGLISWDHYIQFRDSEAALGYPPSHFETFLPDLSPPLRSIILTVLSILTRLTANSATSGHTPPTLSPLFGPLLFGLGPATLAFHHTYIHYLRSANAMEHLLLAFIRWQDSPRPNATLSPKYREPSTLGSASSLGVPTRLKEWIKGYPTMLPFLQERHKNEKPQARRGARTVRVMNVRRNVRMYSPDLVKSAATWAHRSRSSASVNDNGLASSKEWNRIAPPTLKLPPRYSEAYKKRMDMPPNFHPDITPGSDSLNLLGPNEMKSVPSTSSYSSTTSSATGASLLTDQDYFGLGLGAREGEDRFRNLTDLKWGAFESMGFGGGLSDEKKLQFDLTESARTERTLKRATLSWNDFSTAGFTRSDAPLSATLQFSAPVTNTISAWPAHNAEMSRKLKKSQKALPAFGWDTEPVVGNEEVIEEAFIDVFCDLIYGGGWMDLERSEELDRDCNWALIEFKSLPSSRTTATGGSDPRTATSLILFEEFVPLEYREQLAVTSSTRRRLPSLFSPSSKSKSWKQAPTLNGRPYVVGHVPRSPSYREVEFEGLLRGGSGTKVISLGTKSTVRSPLVTSGSRVMSTTSIGVPESPSQLRESGISGPLYVPTTELPSSGKSEEMHSDSTMSPSVKKSRFRLPGGIPVPSPGGHRKSGMLPSEYSSVDFSTRLASYSDDEHNGGVPEPEAAKQKRRELKSDAWVDILVATQNRRMGGQEAVLRENSRDLHARRSNPDLASLEVAQVLAGVRDGSLSTPSLNERVDRDYGMENHLHDLDVDEIETVPRTSGVRESDDADEDSEDEAMLAYATDHELEPEEPEVEPVLTSHQLARQQRRLGYFDLHPERRPVATAPELDDDSRARSGQESEDESHDDDIYGQPPSEPMANLHQDHAVPFQPPREIDIPEFKPTQQVKAAEPPSILPTSPNRNGIAIPKPVTPSKTATLIEMYRERERGTPPKPVVPSATVPIIVAPLATSRLPVRSAAVPLKEGVPSPGSPLQFVAPPGNKSPDLSSPLIDPPRIPLEETGRASPARYVHGAPLHNVLEEEEEERRRFSSKVLQ